MSIKIEYETQVLELSLEKNFSEFLSGISSRLSHPPKHLKLWFDNSHGKRILLDENTYKDLLDSETLPTLKVSKGKFPNPFQLLYLRNYFQRYKQQIKGNVRQVFKNFRNNKYVEMKQLVLNESLIESSSMKHLSTALPLLSFLKELEVRGGKMEYQAAQHLFPSLSNLKTLKKLCVSEIQIEVDTAKMLSQGISELERLEQLKLVETKMSSQAMKTLAVPLSCMELLELVDLRQNELGPEGAKYLSFALVCLKRLKHLNVGQNNILSSGLEYLETSLRKLELTSLILKSNKLNPDSGTTIRNLMKSPSLKTLDVSFNSLKTPGLRQVFAGLHNSSLEELSVSCNKGEANESFCFALIKTNCKVQGSPPLCEKCSRRCSSQESCNWARKFPIFYSRIAFKQLRLV